MPCICNWSKTYKDVLVDGVCKYCDTRRTDVCFDKEMVE